MWAEFAGPIQERSAGNKARQIGLYPIVHLTIRAPAGHGPCAFRLFLMQPAEFRATASLALVFSVRLLGLFMVYPVFAAYAGGLSGANPYLIGEALGIYGLTQGLLQIPFGLLSDKFGRKLMIVIGLLLFIAGSAVAAASTSISGLIFGRALQGAGAVGSVILAMLADLTSEGSRTKAMAVVGITIGGSFLIALVIGPIIAGFVGVPGLFWLMGVLGLAGIAIILLAVPAPCQLEVHRDAETVPSVLGAVLRDRALLRLDLGIFVLHAVLTAMFLVVPGLLRATLDVAPDDVWKIYLPVLLVSVLVMGAAVSFERRQRGQAVFLGAIAALAASNILVAVGGGQTVALIGALVVFFSAFNILEASLPSLVSKAAPAEAKGTALGVYSSLQFLGIFAGGAAGGWLNQHAGSGGVFAFTIALALLWLIGAVVLRPRA
jgi:MFS family permease